MQEIFLKTDKFNPVNVTKYKRQAKKKYAYTHLYMHYTGLSIIIRKRRLNISRAPINKYFFKWTKDRKNPQIENEKIQGANKYLKNVKCHLS